MPVLNTADALYRGADPVSRIYRGTAVVWEPDGEPVDPPDFPVLKSAWTLGGASSNPWNPAPNLGTLAIGDTIFVALALENTGATPSLSVPGSTAFTSEISVTGAIPIRLYRSVVTSAGSKTLTASVNNNRILVSVAAYEGGVVVAQSNSSTGTSLPSVPISGITAPADSSVLAVWALRTNGSTWQGQIDPAATWTQQTRGRLGDDGSPTTPSDRMALTIARKNFATSEATGTVSGTQTGTMSGSVQGRAGFLAALVKA